MKKNNKEIIFVLLMFIVLFNFVSCSGFTCVRNYIADVEYTVSDLVFSVYDKDDGSLISETELTNYDEIQTGDFFNDDRNDFTDTELTFVAYTADAKRLYLKLYIGENFQSLELNDSVKDGMSEYLSIWHYSNEGDADDIQYVRANPIDILYESDGYHITYTVKPYSLDDNEEEVYEDTQKIEFVMSNLTVVEESVVVEPVCSN